MYLSVLFVFGYLRALRFTLHCLPHNFYIRLIGKGLYCTLFSFFFYQTSLSYKAIIKSSNSATCKTHKMTKLYLFVQINKGVKMFTSYSQFSVCINFLDNLGFLNCHYISCIKRLLILMN